MSSDLTGKVAIVTGASQGLGLEIAQRFATAGASVLMCARDAPAVRQAAARAGTHLRAEQRIEAIGADVSRPHDVAHVVQTTRAQFGRIDILVNNAGIYGPMGAIEDVDWEQWIEAIEVNLFGSVLMARAVVPGMKAQGSGKIIQLSGGGATNPLPRITAYAVSKAAIVRFAESLAEELREFHIDVNAIAPGALNTRMLDDVLSAGPQRVGQEFFNRSLQQKRAGGSGLQRGADLAAFLASSASDGITGKLISAVWDDWAQWPTHKAELAASDVYTLRRIVGRDRGMSWGDK